MVEPTQIPSELTFSRNPVIYQFDAAADDDIQENFKVKIYVFFEAEYGSGSFSRKAEIEAKPYQGKVEFNIQQILDDELREAITEPPIPSVDNAEPFFPSVIRQYQIFYQQDYDGYEPLGIIPGEVRKVLWGGISQKLFAGGDYIDGINSNNSLLTWYPSGKDVSPTQPEYISWYNYLGVEKKIILEVVRYTATETLSNRYYFDATGITVPAGEIVCIPTGVNQLGLDADEVVKYDVRVVDRASSYDSGAALYFSPKRTYYVDCLHHETLKYITYLNSFCLPETLRLTGRTTKNLTVNRKQAKAVLPTSYAINSREYFQYAQDWENPYTYRSGYLKSKKEADALQELLIYNQAYLMEKDGLCAIYIDSKKFRITEELQYLHAVEFVARQSMQSINYSCVVMPALPVELGDKKCCCDNTLKFTSGVLLFNGRTLQFGKSCCCYRGIKFNTGVLTFNNKILRMT